MARSRLMMRVETETEKNVAVLPDVVEDSRRSAGMCDAERGRTYEEFIRRSLTHPVARRVKLADIKDNLDIRRLATLTDRDADRLRRYLTTWRVLTGTA